MKSGPNGPISIENFRKLCPAGHEKITTAGFFFKLGISNSMKSKEGSSMSLSDGLMNAQTMDKPRTNSKGSRSVKCLNNKIVSGNTISQGDVLPKFYQS